MSNRLGLLQNWPFSWWRNYETLISPQLRWKKPVEILDSKVTKMVVKITVHFSDSSLTWDLKNCFTIFLFFFFFTFEITTATMNNNETDNKYVYFSVKGRQLLLLFFVLSSANWLYRIEWDQLIIVEWNCLSSPLSLDEDRFWLILFGWIVGVSWKLFPVEFNEQLISDWIDPLIWTVSFVAANCFVWSLSGRGPGAGKGGGREGLTELS